MDRLQGKAVQNTTASNYLAIWRNFSKFMLKPEQKPKTWEERVSWFCAYLIDKGTKSSTIKSYISALKATLRDDGYKWVEDRVAFSALIRACKIKNDVIKCRFPIHKGLLEMILFEVERIVSSFYLVVLYRAMLSIAYYGMM